MEQTTSTAEQIDTPNLTSEYCPDCGIHRFHASPGCPNVEHNPTAKQKADALAAADTSIADAKEAATTGDQSRGDVNTSGPDGVAGSITPSSAVSEGSATVDGSKTDAELLDQFTEEGKARGLSQTDAENEALERLEAFRKTEQTPVV